VPSARIGLQLFISRGSMLPVVLAISGAGRGGTSEVNYREPVPSRRSVALLPNPKRQDVGRLHGLRAGVSRSCFDR
jgi:hypothetical protein